MPDSQKISEKQSEYMKLIAEIMDIRKRGEKPVAYIRTYGCQQNVADSEKIKGMLEQSGFELQMNRTMRISYFSIPVRKRTC